MRVARRFLISGRVQGVGFRYFTLRIAHKYNIQGSVRNLADGRVEVYAEGEQDKMQKFLTELRIGPSLSSVEDIRLEETAPHQGDPGFHIE